MGDGRNGWKVGLWLSLKVISNRLAPTDGELNGGRAKRLESGVMVVSEGDIQPSRPYGW